MTAILNVAETKLNPFQPSVAFHRETGHLIYNANQRLVSICNATPSWTGLTENENIICEKCLFTHFMPLVSFYIPCKHQKTSGENKFGWKCYYKTKPFRGLFEEFCTQSYILHLKARTKTFLLEKIKFFANIR